ncbi:hypothetical protein FHS31_003042 [Sphingomonas vulcanisoli]|uniref:Uncharacterized protein n=1 Tax=Sphingomonas vulcanisoli TaxID=1658060 RepID=A0ABX0TYB4_9SPHN|nr:hypothetical protein [Sphingomonas vulcanisoli]NIJ09410.1 hypothetical protein [Sphingomonas vulcanisoli]
MSHVSLALMFDLFLAGTCLFAFVWGGGPEKVGSALNVAASVATTALRLLDPRFFAPANAVIFAIDLLVLVGFFWLAVRSTRFWPVWAFGFALADVVLSVTAALLPHVPLFAFHTGLGVYAYLALGAMTLGTWTYRASRRAGGTDPSWRNRMMSPS